MGKSADKEEKRRTVSDLLLKKQQEVFVWAEKERDKSAARGAQARQGEGVPGHPPALDCLDFFGFACSEGGYAMSVLQEGASGGRQVCWLPMAEIRPNPQQPRREFDDLRLMELASSIRQHGLLQPITVRPMEEGYEIVMGERRFRACQMLGFTHIDAFVLAATGQETALLALIENLQRENLHFFEEAEAYADLLGQGMSQEALARRLGKSPSGVANKLRLLKLEPALRHLLLEEGLSERHARALLPLPDAAARMRIAAQAARDHLTVRETEALVQKALRRLPVPPPSRRMISLVRDPRLYLNAIKSVVSQMQESGMQADYSLQESDGWLEARIRLPKNGKK